MVGRSVRSLAGRIAGASAVADLSAYRKCAELFRGFGIRQSDRSADLVGRVKNRKADWTACGQRIKRCVSLLSAKSEKNTSLAPAKGRP
jgi:hypothetical protein